MNVYICIILFYTCLFFAVINVCDDDKLEGVNISVFFFLAMAITALTSASSYRVATKFSPQSNPLHTTYYSPQSNPVHRLRITSSSSPSPCPSSQNPFAEQKSDPFAEKKVYRDSPLDLLFINGCRQVYGRLANWQVS